MTAISAIGTLLVAVVALWATIRVSGLEDYFHSEIEHRNRENEIAERRATDLDRRAASLRDIMEKLQASFDALARDTTVEQGEYFETKTKLLGLEVDSAKAQQALFAAESEARRIEDENRQLSDSNGTITNHLFSTLVGAYLAQEHPTIKDIVTQPFNTFLYAPTDPLFRASSDSDAVSFVFVEGGADEKDAFKTPENELCRVAASRYVAGIEFGMSTKMTMSVAALQLSHSPLYKKICELLSTRMYVYSLASRLPKEGDTRLLDVLRRGSSLPVIISFVPGSFQGLSYEEFRIRGYWFRMVGDLFDDRAVEMSADDLDRNFANEIDRSGTYSQSFTPYFNATMDSVDHELKQKGLKQFQDKLHTFDDSWLQYTTDSTIYVRLRSYTLQSNGRYEQIVPRATGDKLDTEFILSNYDLLRSFDYAINCVAIKFAVDAGYSSRVKVPEYGNCSTIAKLSRDFEKMAPVSLPPNLRPKR